MGDDTSYNYEEVSYSCWGVDTTKIDADFERGTSLCLESTALAVPPAVGIKVRKGAGFMKLFGAERNRIGEVMKSRSQAAYTICMAG